MQDRPGWRKHFNENVTHLILLTRQSFEVNTENM